MKNQKIKKLEREIIVLKTERAGNWTVRRSEVLDIMSCEGLIMQFLNKGASRMDEIPAITHHNLFDFWKWVQQKKDTIGPIK